MMCMDEFLGKDVDIDFMFFKADFISLGIKDAAFEGIEIIERDPYPDVEYQSRRAYVFAKKPIVNRKLQQSLPAERKKPHQPKSTLCNSQERNLPCLRYGFRSLSFFVWFQL